jgi:tripeptide aminopeptidase
MSIENYMHSTAERLMRYVQIDTQSDPNSPSQPSTLKQKDLSKILVEELHQLGINDALLDEFGYVYATIPATINNENIPTICFCAHVDTAPDCSGTNVKPILHKNYSGEDIVLPDDTNIIISTNKHPYLKQKIGDDIITASGTTLLGADDKAGVAIIMDVAAYLMQHQEIPHGAIRILFTPDEEVGRGVNAVNMQQLNARYGYTLDGGERGHLEGENFSADAATVTFYGVSAHPGYAKGKMVNAMKVAGAFIDALPKNEWSPETTSDKEGFVHPVAMTGELEQASVSFIIRDFDTQNLKQHALKLSELAQNAIDKFPGATYKIEVKEQYRNMLEILKDYPEVMDNAVKAYERAGINAELISIRGGTDGSRLSFMGMPCPNIFTGEMGIHSKQEYVSVQDMNKAVQVCVELAQVWAGK